MIEEREVKLAELRQTLSASVARGGSFTDAEVAEAVEDRLNRESKEQHRKPNPD